MLPPSQCKHHNFRLRTRLCHFYSQESLPSSSGWPTGSTLGVLVAGELGILYAWGPQMSDDGRCRFTCFLGPGPTQQDFLLLLLYYHSHLQYNIQYIRCIYIYIMYTIVCCKRAAKDPILFPWTGIGSLQPRGSPKEYLVEIKCQACMCHIIQDYSYPGLFWGQSKVWIFDISKAPVQGPSRTNPWLWHDLLQGRYRLQGISMKHERHQTRFFWL